ncbi:hypothetical protein [Endozoicomonas sp. 4G]|uniref:hypothetical protein n=1 Tax=Endozoicomonas sp. 4G TaxID=2872754 RepID=UPI0020787E95|nr:hypothetical protein [Endozoicomonas sp. 4G]
MDEYEKYEAECEKVRAENKKLLDEFEGWLKSSRLSDKTIRTHLQNIDFYINHYLLYEDVIKPENGAHGVDMFLGYWFIRKAMWASPSTIKSNAASLKKFYSFLLEKNLIDRDDLEDLKESIKEGIPEWIEKAEIY